MIFNFEDDYEKMLSERIERSLDYIFSWNETENLFFASYVKGKLIDNVLLDRQSICGFHYSSNGTITLIFKKSNIKNTTILYYTEVPLKVISMSKSEIEDFYENLKKEYLNELPF